MLMLSPTTADLPLSVCHGPQKRKNLKKKNSTRYSSPPGGRRIGLELSQDYRRVLLPSNEVVQGDSREAATHDHSFEGESLALNLVEGYSATWTGVAPLNAF